MYRNERWYIHFGSTFSFPLIILINKALGPDYCWTHDQCNLVKCLINLRSVLVPHFIVYCFGWSLHIDNAFSDENVCLQALKPTLVGSLFHFKQTWRHLGLLQNKSYCGWLLFNDPTPQVMLVCFWEYLTLAKRGYKKLADMTRVCKLEAITSWLHESNLDARQLIKNSDIRRASKMT